MSKVSVAFTYTVERVALMLHVSPKMILEAIEEGRLKAIKEDGALLIPEDSMREFMEDGNPFVAWVQYTLIHRGNGVEMVSGTRLTNLDEAVAAAQKMNEEAGSPIASVWRIEHAGSRLIQHEDYEVIDKETGRAVESCISSECAVASAMARNRELSRHDGGAQFVVRTTNSTWEPVEV